MSDAWRVEHGKTIDSFLDFLYKKSDQYILKGGTSLMKCYGLNRFSEDIDLDGRGKKKDIIFLIENFCKEKGFSFRIGADTDTKKKCFINYGNTSHPLKIETSFRRKDFSDAEINVINGITVYSINDLCIQKTSAYLQRDKIRDLFDLTFITNNFYDELYPMVRSSLRSALEHKGLEQFDYIVREQEDELIDVDVLSENFLIMFDKLGLLTENQEKEVIQEHSSVVNYCSDVNYLIDDATVRCTGNVNHSILKTKDDGFGKE